MLFPPGWYQVFPGGEIMNLATGAVVFRPGTTGPDPGPTRTATLTLQPDRVTYLGNWTLVSGAVTTSLLINGARVRTRTDPEGTVTREFPFLSTTGTYQLEVVAGSVTILSPVYNWAPPVTEPDPGGTPTASLAITGDTSMRGTWSPVTGQVTTTLLLNGSPTRVLTSPAGTVVRDFTALTTAGSYQLRVQATGVDITSPVVQWAPPVVEPDPDPGGGPDPEPPSSWPNGPTIMLSATDGAANRNTLQQACANNDSFTWDAPGTGVVPLAGSVVIAHRCRRIRAANATRVIEQKTNETAVWVKHGQAAHNLRPMSNIPTGGRTVTASTAGWSVGDWLYLQSENPIKANSKQMIGLLAKITALGAGNATVDLAAPSAMTMNPRVAKVNMAPSVEIDGGVFQHANPVSQYFRDMIGFYAITSPRVTSRTIVQRGGPGVGLYLTADALIEANIRYLVDDHNGTGWRDHNGNLQPNPLGQTIYGYAVPIYGPNRRVKIRGQASYTRHAGTTNSASGKQVSYVTNENNSQSGPWYPQSGDCPEVDHSTNVTRNTSTPVSSHEALGTYWFHDCDVWDSGLYWSLYGSNDGKENTDWMNMRSNSLIENVRFWHRIAERSNFGCVLQNLLDPSLPDPFMRVKNCIMYGSTSGVRNKGGRVDVSNTTIYLKANATGIFNESGITTGNNIRIIGYGSGTTGVRVTNSGSVTLTNVRFENVGTKQVGSNISITESASATGSTLTLPFTP